MLLGCFASGLVCGAVFFGQGLVTFATAALDQASAERQYDDLAREVSAMQQGSKVIARVAKLTTPSVVHIQSRREVAGKGTVEETGSGIIMSSSKSAGYFVVTNRHVIDGAAPGQIAVSLSDGRVLNPEQIWSDKDTDLAALKLTAAGLIPGRWGDSNDVEIGHMVLAVGSPFGLSQSVTFGIISAKGRRSLKLGNDAQNVMNQDFLQTDAAINPGNSGGPLIDLQGRVVGINTAIASSSGGNEGIGFSIPSNLAQRVIDQLLEYGFVQRAYLGVKLDPAFEMKTAQRLKLDRVSGARVTDVYQNTPASKAGLLVDDVILQFDNVDIQDENHLIHLVSLTPVGKQIRLSVWRNGVKTAISVLLADRTDLRQSNQQNQESGKPTPVRPMGLVVEPAAEQVGVRVLKVDLFSTLATEVRPNDVIVEFGRKPVKSTEELKQFANQAQRERDVLLKLRRREAGEVQDVLVMWQR